MREYPSLVGNRYGMLVVLQQEPSSGKGKRRWLCRCDCGNTHTAETAALNRGRSTSCGCKKSRDLTGQVFGGLTVLKRSERRGSRGARTTPLWVCLCSCGAITEKAADSLSRQAESMCRTCAAANASEKARDAAGYVGGTQLSKLAVGNNASDNSAGHRGVYHDKRNNTYRARIKFRGKMIELGSYRKFEDAVAARREAELEYFGTFLAALQQNPNGDKCDANGLRTDCVNKENCIKEEHDEQ